MKLLREEAFVMSVVCEMHLQTIEIRNIVIKNALLGVLILFLNFSL